MAEVFQILAGLLGLVGSQGDRSLLEFGLDSSKQLLAFGVLHLLGTSLSLSELLSEATLGVAVEYLLLRSCSPWIFEQMLQNKALRTGVYHDEKGEFDPTRYLHQLWIWLLCVLASQYVLVFLQLPALCQAVDQVLLAPLGWIDLESPTSDILCCLCRALQFRLTDLLVLNHGGLAPPQAAQWLLWAACAAAQWLLSAVHRVSESLQSLPSLPLQQPLLDVEEAPSPGRARQQVEKAKERLAPKNQAPPPPTSTAPTAPLLPKAPPALKAPDLRDRSPSPKKPKSGGTWARDGEKRLATGKTVMPVNVQVQSLKGMIAERDSDLKELHENLDELLKDFSGVVGLDAVSPLPSFSPTVENSPNELSGRSSPSAGDHGFSGPPATWAPYPSHPSHPSYPSNGWMPGPGHLSQPKAEPEKRTETRSSGYLDRRSRRYDVLDKKIDSLLNALGAPPALPSPPPLPAPATPPMSSVPSSAGGFLGSQRMELPREVSREVPIDQRIEVLQNKMDQLFRLRDQHALPK